MDPVQSSQFSSVASRGAALNQLRWFGLAAILLVAGLAGRLTAGLGGVCALYALWLVWAGLGADLGPSRSWIDGAKLGADVALALASIALSGGQQSPLWWALWLPAAPGARLFGLWVGAALGLGGWVMALAVSVLMPPSTVVAWHRLALTGVGVLLGALLVAWLATRWLDDGAGPDDGPSRAQRAENNKSLDLLQMASRLNEDATSDQLALRIIDLVRAVLEQNPGQGLSPAGLWIGSSRQGGWQATTGFAPGQASADGGGLNALDEALQSGQIRVLDAPGEDTFVAHWHGLETVGGVVIVPLTMPGGGSLGAVLVGVNSPDTPSGEVLAQLRAVGRYAALVWDNAGRYQDLLKEKNRLNELQEEARRRLARNLHDGPTQSIASIAMRANFARRQITRDPEAAEEEVAKVEEMARQTTREIRHMLFTLRPLILESQGLGPALYQLALKARDSHDEDIQLEIDPDSAAGMDPGVQGALFYIVEEAVTNAQKHAAAEHIWIRLKQISDGLRLEVEDDGVGFNVGAVDAHYEQRGSLGMVNMRERAELAGGVLGVKSTESRGTLISVILPSGDRAAEGGSG